MKIIGIDKNFIPYNFEIELSNRVYELEIEHNFLFDFFTITLKLNNKILASEKATLNEILFKEFYLDKKHNRNEEFPKEILIFMTNDDNITRINFENLNESVFLFCNTIQEIEEEMKE